MRPDALPFTDPSAHQPGRLAEYYRLLHESDVSTFYDERSQVQVVWRHEHVSRVLSGADSRVSNTTTLDPLTPRTELARNPRNWPSLLRLAGSVVPATANARDEVHRSVRDAVYDRTDPRSLHRPHTRRNYGDLVAGQVNETADQFAERLDRCGTVDLAEHFARPLAAQTIARVVGFAPTDAAHVRRWSDAQTTLLGRRLGRREQAPALAGLAALATACLSLTRRRGRRGEHDLTSLLAERPQLSRRRVGSTVMNLIAAGYSTTYGTLLNSLRFLLSDGRHHWQRLDDEHHLDLLVPELIRLETGLIGWKRSATDDIPLPGNGGVIPKGRRILALLGAANRDPVFHEPDTVRFDRRGQGMPTPVSFGIGPHLCMGRELAIITLRTALVELRRRFPGLTIGDERALTYDPDILFRTLGSLPVAAPDITSGTPQAGTTGP